MNVVSHASVRPLNSYVLEKNKENNKAEVGSWQYVRHRLSDILSFSLISRLFHIPLSSSIKGVVRLLELLQLPFATANAILRER